MGCTYNNWKEFIMLQVVFNLLESSFLRCGITFCRFWTFPVDHMNFELSELLLV